MAINGSKIVHYADTRRISNNATWVYYIPICGAKNVAALITKRKDVTCKNCKRTVYFT